MENKSHHDHTSDVLMNLSFEYLKEITGNFAEEHKLGRGTFGEVYKGKLKDGKVIAVKMLRSTPGIDDKQFKNEYELLKKLKHQNIVQLGTLPRVCAQWKPYKLLSEQSLLLNWEMRFNMIKEICEGLRYLHTLGIMHLDLKPDNILIDEKMVPKIVDFGLSRLVGTANTIVTGNPLGTIGYIPPEFTEQQIISYKYDIFSLGIIIKKIVDSEIADMDDKEFIEDVLDNWKKRFQEITGNASQEVEIGIEQVRTCIEIAADCTKRDWRTRPAMDEIIYKLDEVETAVAVRLMLAFKDDEQPPRSKANSFTNLVRMKPMRYSKGDAALTGDTVTVDVKLNAAESIVVREHLDLVVVLDVSGSIAGETMDNMRRATKYVLMKLQPLDRLSIVTFSDSATRQCPLRCLTGSSLNDLKAIVDGLDLSPNLNLTNIKAGLETAIAVVNGRVNKRGRIGKILLVSVKPQNVGDARIVKLGKVDVFSIGFDKDADSQLLCDISRRSPSGTYSQVPGGSNISAPFAQLLASLVTMVAQDVRLTLTPQTNAGDLDTIVVERKSNATETTDRATGVITIEFGEVFGGEAHEIVVKLTLLASEETEEYDADLALAQLSYTVQGVVEHGDSQDINITRTPNPTPAACTSRSTDDDHDK